MSDLAFKNKVVLITGGAHGIGQATAEAFKKAGATVEIIDIAPGDHFVGDISQKETLEAFADHVLKKHHQVDVLVNNALPLMVGLDQASFEDFQKALTVGVTAPVYLSQLFASHFASGASIINVSSSRYAQSQAQTESYSAAKGGITSLTHALAMSFAGKVRVNAVAPGWIETSDSVHSDADNYQHPVGRVGVPDDIAHMILYLASDKAGFITGQTITVDGGMSKKMIYHEDENWSLKLYD
ncbi:SDR family NAD(P)-dependent oxidoreductase [Streptococcus pluranimalium]|uniref:SDR family NAD(P)-dependent oxidoreductase n=1 Tax=Streptococcus pluranimalium TaxID=82348 RepID=UPI002A7D282F|nr:SDR family oxidoreductase [Streptococcus pluranimalium]